MGERSETVLVGLVLLACASVLFAPIVGRSGWPALATALMVVAAGAGVGSFALAFAATVRASRRAPRAGAGREEP